MSPEQAGLFSVLSSLFNGKIHFIIHHFTDGSFKKIWFVLVERYPLSGSQLGFDRRENSTQG